jgi:phage host-nuclease inhibitor protein Gam
MPKLTADADEIRDQIDDRTDVDDLLEEASDLARETKKRERKMRKSTANLHDRKDELEEQIEEIESKHEGYIERRRQAIQARKEAICSWARQNTEAALDGVEGRTYESPFGSVSFTKVPFNFDWEDKDAVLQSLKELGREELIRRTEKVPYKSTLKDEPGLVKRLDGVEPQPEHDEVSVDIE